MDKFLTSNPKVIAALLLAVVIVTFLLTPEFLKVLVNVGVLSALLMYCMVYLRDDFIQLYYWLSSKIGGTSGGIEKTAPATTDGADAEAAEAKPDD